MRRIFLFVATNLAVLIILSIVLNIILAVLRIPPGNMAGLMVLAFVFGMGGSFISLAMSKTIAKWSTGAKVIEQARSDHERWLVETVRRHAQRAGIGMPEVAIYDAREINAFATGMSRNHSLVAVSSGLLTHMTPDEAEAVLGHEITHAANGDMTTLALIQGVLNTFVIFLARVIGNLVSSGMQRDEGEGLGGGFAYFAVVIVLQIVLGFLASIVVMWFSRWREFRADAGGARLSTRDKMIAALERLRQEQQPSTLPDQMAAFGIKGGQGGFTALLRSHPPLEARIAALRKAAIT